MKYCLNALQDSAYLEKADEISLPYRGIHMFSKLVEKYPNKTIIVSISMSESDTIDWDDLRSKQILSQNHMILCLATWADMEKAKEYKIPFFYMFAVASFWDAQALRKLGVCYMRITAPIFFQMEKVKSLNVPIRIIANIGYVGGVPHPDAYAGAWIRPEDVKWYESYVDVIEFSVSSNEEERALYRIYAEENAWPGEWYYIFKQYPENDTFNRMLRSDEIGRRLNCGQRCQEPGRSCHLCQHLFYMASPEFAKLLKEKVES